MSKRLASILKHAAGIDHDANPAQDRLNHVERMFGLSEADYFALIVKQGAVCAICGRKGSHARKSGRQSGTYLAVDHCHDSERVRGLLCTNCNTGLGMFKDSADLLRLAAAYLERSRE